MKTERLHKFFKKVGVFQLKYRWLCLALLAAVTVAGILGVKSFKVSSADEDEFITVKETAKKTTHGLKNCSAVTIRLCCSLKPTMCLSRKYCKRLKISVPSFWKKFRMRIRLLPLPIRILPSVRMKELKSPIRLKTVFLRTLAHCKKRKILSFHASRLSISL